MFAGLLAGLGVIRTKAWGDARNRELDRHIVGTYEPEDDEVSREGAAGI